MTARHRLIYSKRGGACFVPHIVLPQVFARSAMRAGLKLQMTQGYSPHAKISFGPELPAGVAALNEPADMYFAESYEDVKMLMNKYLPEGFSIERAKIPPEQSPSLGKLCTHAEYLMRSANGINLSVYAEKFFNASLVDVEDVEDWQKIIVKSPAQNPIGGLVKFMMQEKIIAGWHEINIVRVSIGRLDSLSHRLEI